MKITPEILLVDDNPADVDLTSEALARTKRQFNVSTVQDGAEALSFLRREGKYQTAPVPDLIVLDLNLPRTTGKEVLSEVKTNPKLSKTPVVIFTTSEAKSDITGSYELGANCYFRKPGNLAEFIAVVQAMADFWFGFARLPQKEKREDERSINPCPAD